MEGHRRTNAANGAQAPHPRHRDRRDRSLRRAYRAVATLAVAVYVTLTVGQWQATLGESASELRYFTHTLEEVTRSMLAQQEQTLRVLGERLIERGWGSGRPSRGQDLLVRASAVDPNIVRYLARRPNGDSIFRLGGTDGHASAHFARALTSRRLALGPPALDAEAGHYVLPLHLSAQAPSGERLILTAHYSIGAGTSAWANLRLPEAVRAALIDPDGRVYLTTRSLADPSGAGPSVHRSADALEPLDIALQVAREAPSAPLYLPTTERALPDLAYATTLSDYDLQIIATRPLGEIAAAWFKGNMPALAFLVLFLATSRQAYRRIRTAQQDHDDALLTQALTDPLTGTGNRFGLIDHLKRLIPGPPVALAFIDLDNFKRINDSFGHSVGDALLRTVSKRLERIVGPHGRVFRFGGDEFVILLRESSGSAPAEALAEQVIEALAEPSTIDGNPFCVEASIGVARYPEHAGAANALISRADLALYRAKDAGKRRVATFDKDLEEGAERRFRVDELVRTCAPRGELALFYQPQVSARTRLVHGAEALVRWSSPILGSISPGEFIPIAESNGAIREIELWVLRTLCRDWKANRRQWPHGFRLSFNLSARSLLSPATVAAIVQIITEEGIPPGVMVAEITETAVLTDLDAAIAAVEQIHQAGLEVSLDDFGTGYSSLTFLAHLPVAEMKIDRAFVGEITSSTRLADLVESTVTLGRRLGMRVVAEGVEREDEVRLLKAWGCDLLQGYHFARPSPLSALLRALAAEAA